MACRISEASNAWVENIKWVGCKKMMIVGTISVAKSYEKNKSFVSHKI